MDGEAGPDRNERPPNAVTGHRPKRACLGRLEQTPTEQSGHKTITITPSRELMTRAHDATDTAITQATVHLVAHHQDPTVGAVAQATGVARGTIYRYLPTRQA